MFTRIHFLTSSYDHLTVLFILFVFLTSKALIQSLNNFYVFVLDRGVMNLKVLIWLRLVFFYCPRLLTSLRPMRLTPVIFSMIYTMLYLFKICDNFSCFPMVMQQWQLTELL